MYTVKDVERISDHCDNIADLAEEMSSNSMLFSMEAQDGLKEMTIMSVDALESALVARREGNTALGKESILRVTALEEDVDRLRKELRRHHMGRVARNECSSSRGIIFLDILSNMERISDHSLNIVNYIAEEAV